ncbi:MAG: hypothetical protein RIQ93_167 [Verrucomicrobiota bacterium]
MLNRPYLPIVLHELERLKKLADLAVAQISSEQFFAVPAAEDNSIAVIIKHVSGNMISRWKDFLTTDGEKPDRDRDMEFELTPEDTREWLLARWNHAWDVLFAELKALEEPDLGRTITIRGEPLSVLQGINRQLTHYAYHVGQIVYVARHVKGSGWKSLTIPKGQSEQFNRAPAPYLKKL